VFRFKIKERKKKLYELNNDVIKERKKKMRMPSDLK